MLDMRKAPLKTFTTPEVVFFWHGISLKKRNREKGCGYHFQSVNAPLIRNEHDTARILF